MPCHYNDSNSGGSLVGFINFASGNEDNLLQAAAIEPVAVAINSSPSFCFYHSYAHLMGKLNSLPI